jgi:hypothetical protein
MKEMMIMSKVLFFCRGYGSDYAQRDMILVDCLSKLDSNIEIKFVSYGDGYRTISAKGFSCINTGLPSKDNDHDRLIKIGLAIKDEKADLIISDEDLLALPLAKIFGIPSLLIANWFPPSSGHPTMGYFTDPEVIIFPDIEGTLVAPSMIKDSVHFTGPILPPVESSIEERGKYKDELGIPGSFGKLILVLGRDMEEKDVWFFRCCIKAFKSLGLDARMIVVAGGLKEELEQEIKDDERILIREYIYHPEKYILSSDIVVHRGGYFTLWKLARFGIPSICIPHPSGDFRFQNLARARSMEKWGTTIVVEEKDLEGDRLVSEMMDILSSRERWEEMSQACLEISRQEGSKRAAEVVLSKLRKSEMGGKDLECFPNDGIASS